MNLRVSIVGLWRILDSYISGMITSQGKFLYYTKYFHNWSIKKKKNEIEVRRTKGTISPEYRMSSEKGGWGEEFLPFFPTISLPIAILKMSSSIGLSPNCIDCTTAPRIWCTDRNGNCQTNGNFVLCLKRKSERISRSDKKKRRH